MLKAFVILLIIAAGLIIGPMWSGDSGTLILLVGSYSIEMSLVVATVILFIALFVIWLIKLVLQKLFRGHSVTLQWLRNRKQRQAEELLERAFTEWLAKNYVATAQLAEKAARHHIRPTQCYLMAASAYQALGNAAEQQRLITLATQQDGATLAVQLTQLEYSNNSGEALRIAQHLLQEYPRNMSVLRAAAAAMFRHKHLQSLRELLPALNDEQALPRARLAEYTRACYRSYFNTLGADREKLLEAWSALPKKQRRNTSVRLGYLDILIERGFGAVAAKVAARGLHHQVLTASDLLPYDARSWRETAELRNEIELKVKAHPQHPNWLLLLAVIAIQDGDAALAERAAQKAISIKPDSLAYRILGDALFANNQRDGALNAFRQAVLLRQG